MDADQSRKHWNPIGFNKELETRRESGTRAITSGFCRRAPGGRVLNSARGRAIR